MIHNASRPRRASAIRGGWPGALELTNPQVLARFEVKIDVDPVTGCRLWTAAIDADGYGRMTAHKKSYAAHRFIFQKYFGPINNPNLDIGHECGSRHCANIDHLHLITSKDHEDETWEDRRRREREGKEEKE
ncbi:HNH endonuclease [Nitrospira sp. Nam74]